MRTMILLFAIVATIPAEANDCEARDQHRAEVAAMFSDGDIEALDERAAELREHQPRTPSGLLFSGQFYVGIRDALPENPQDDEAWRRAYATADAWIAAYPNSPAGYIAKANIHYQHGRAFRKQGGGVLEILFPGLYRHQQWKKALDLLDEHHRIAASDPEYYSVLLSVQQWRGVRRPVFRSALDEALAKFPDHDEIYFRGSGYYSPLFSGSTEDVDALAREAVTRTEATRGHELYVRIHWASPQRFTQSIATSHVDTEMFRQGVADMLEDYPAQWNIQHLRYFARIRGNREMVNELTLMVEGPPIRNSEGFLACP